MTDFKLEAFLPYQLSVLAGRMSRGFAAIYETRFGITVAEWRVLAHLHDAGSCSVRDIHKEADLEKSRVSRAVARLEARGLVERSPGAADKRLLSLRLSPAGAGLVAEILPLALAFEEEALARLSDPAAFRAAIADGLTHSPLTPAGPKGE
ncbi:MAG: MarR family transcriptional regulator [Pseudomonadota bacterium]